MSVSSIEELVNVSAQVLVAQETLKRKVDALHSFWNDLFSSDSEQLKVQVTEFNAKTQSSVLSVESPSAPANADSQYKWSLYHSGGPREDISFKLSPVHPSKKLLATLLTYLEERTGLEAFPADDGSRTIEFRTKSTNIDAVVPRMQKIGSAVSSVDGRKGPRNMRAVEFSSIHKEYFAGKQLSKYKLIGSRDDDIYARSGDVALWIWKENEALYIKPATTNTSIPEDAVGELSEVTGLTFSLVRSDGNKYRGTTRTESMSPRPATSTTAKKKREDLEQKTLPEAVELLRAPAAKHASRQYLVTDSAGFRHVLGFSDNELIYSPLDRKFKPTQEDAKRIASQFDLEAKSRKAGYGFKFVDPLAKHGCKGRIAQAKDRELLLNSGSTHTAYQNGGREIDRQQLLNQLPVRLRKGLTEVADSRFYQSQYAGKSPRDYIFLGQRNDELLGVSGNIPFWMWKQFGDEVHIKVPGDVPLPQTTINSIANDLGLVQVPDLNKIRLVRRGAQQLAQSYKQVRLSETPVQQVVSQKSIASQESMPSSRCNPTRTPMTRNDAGAQEYRGNKTESPVRDTPASTKIDVTHKPASPVQRAPAFIPTAESRAYESMFGDKVLKQKMYRLLGERAGDVYGIHDESRFRLSRFGDEIRATNLDWESDMDVINELARDLGLDARKGIAARSVHFVRKSQLVSVSLSTSGQSELEPAKASPAYGRYKRPPSSYKLMGSKAEQLLGSTLDSKIKFWMWKNGQDIYVKTLDRQSLPEDVAHAIGKDINMQGSYLSEMKTMIRFTPAFGTLTTIE